MSLENTLIQAFNIVWPYIVPISICLFSISFTCAMIEMKRKDSVDILQKRISSLENELKGRPHNGG